MEAFKTIIRNGWHDYPKNSNTCKQKKMEGVKKPNRLLCLLGQMCAEIYVTTH